MSGTAWWMVRKVPQIDPDGVVPLGRLEFLDRRPDTVDAGIGQHEVEAAELALDLLEEVGHRLFVRCVCRDWQGPAAKVFNLLADRVDFILGAAHKNDVGASFGETQRRRGTDP
jgi:hypothetical protein